MLSFHVKFVQTDRRIDGQTGNSKTIHPPPPRIFPYGGIINVTEKLKFVLERLENIVGKGENAGYQHFLLYLQVPS